MFRTRRNASSPVQSAPKFLNSALNVYEKETKINLLTHPLADQFRSCDSPTAISSVFQDVIQQVDQHHTSDELDATVKVLYSFSGTLGESDDHVSLN